MGAVAILAASACTSAAEEATSEEEPAPAIAQGAVTPGFEFCEDLPEFESSVMGNLERVLDRVEDPELRHKRAILRYGQQHPGTFGGYRTDRLMGGAIVVAFTDDVEAHRTAIAALVPSRVKFDVVQVDHSERELLAVHHGVASYTGPAYGLTGVGLNTTRNRVTLHFNDPPAGALNEIAQLVPVDMVCANVYISPEPPSGPLEVIPDLAADDPMVICGGYGPMPYSRFLNPPHIDDVDHPAVERLRAALDSPPGRLLPAGEFHVMDIDEDSVSFAAFSDEGIKDVTVIYGRGRWRIGGWSSDAYSCDVRVALPPGLGYVGIYRDAEAAPASADAAVDLQVRISGCVKGRDTGDVLRGPQIVETDDEVLVAFAAVGASVTDDCAAVGGFPWIAPVRLVLSEPLGTRALRDGTYLSPKAITPWEDPHSARVQEPGGEPAQFVSMWGHERGDDSNDALSSGTLVIEAPCVYIVSDIGYQESGEPWLDRSLIRLPRSGTRYDAETGEVWVWDDGPFVTGDQVGAGGGGGSPEDDAAECSFDSVWSATGLYPNGPQLGAEELLEAVNYVPSPPFEAMLYENEYGPMSVGASVRVGTLALEPPCAYLLVVPPREAGAASPPERHLLHLPRLGARYDGETGELWVFSNGPFATGDQVGAIGGEFAKGRDAPSCSYDHTWGTVHIKLVEDLP